MAPGVGAALTSVCLGFFPITRRVGLVPAILLGGAMTLGVTALWMWRFPALRTMDRFPGQPIRLPASGKSPAYAAGAYASAKLSL